jgi:hypothetical protein
MTHQDKRKSPPVARKTPGGGNPLQAAGQPVTIEPLDAMTGCVVVEVYDPPQGARIRAAQYLGSGQQATYTPKIADSSWIVDVPAGFFTPRDEIRQAIAFAYFDGKGKPPGPPEW